MITQRKFYEVFESQFLMRRQNPGGTSPYLQGYLLGFAGTVNILEALDQDELDPEIKKGTVKLKIGSGEVQVKPVYFSGAFPAELTPEQAAQALNAAGFEDCEFSVDNETGRLRLSPDDASIKWVQIYGDLAAALRFGNCRYGEGKGCYIWASFDGDLKSAAEEEQWSEDKVIENDSPLGTPVRYTIPGRRTGAKITLTDRLNSHAAKQMINGGRWITGADGGPETYEPPTGASSEPCRVDVFTYSRILGKYVNTLGDEVFVRERMYIGCVGRLKRTGGGGSMSDSEYALTAADYTGDDGRVYASPRESDFTQAQWEAMQMDNVIVNDWENA